MGIQHEVHSEISNGIVVNKTSCHSIDNSNIAAKLISLFLIDMAPTYAPRFSLLAKCEYQSFITVRSSSGIAMQHNRIRMLVERC